MIRQLALGVAALALWAPAAGVDVQDAASPAPAGIVFVGSSIFHRWTNLQAQMAPLPIANLAFDGAVTEDILRLVDSRVLPRRPKVVAYYCGSNDISLGEPAGPIVARIRQFIDRVTTALPESQVVFVSINRAPDKQDRWDVVDDVNRQIAEVRGSERTRHLRRREPGAVQCGRVVAARALHERPAAPEAAGVRGVRAHPQAGADEGARAAGRAIN